MNTPRTSFLKRILCLLLALPLAFGLCACPVGEPGTTDGPGVLPDTPPQYIDNLGERNYNGEAFTVSVLDTYKNEAYAEEDVLGVFMQFSLHFISSDIRRIVQTVYHTAKPIAINKINIF